MKINIKKVLKAVMFFNKAKKKVEMVKTIASALKPNREVVQSTPKPTISALPKRDINPAARRISTGSYDPSISSSHSHSSSSSSSDSSSSSSSSCD